MTPCIEFTGCRNPKGYGVVGREGRIWLAHRWAWTQVNGPIPDGLCVCHRCDNRVCINVEHLWLGTKADNNADMFSKGRANPVRGERHMRAKLTDDRVRAIRSEWRAERGQITEFARRYRVDPSVISVVVHGQAWRHVS